jgi:serine phosphatase RsbU (regulator of sigma subunit)
VTRSHARSTDPRPAWRPARVAAIVSLVGLLLTAGVTWGAFHVGHDTDRRLLEVQTKQAAAVVSASVLTIEGPLQTGLDIATATGGNPARFRAFIGAYTAKGGLFASASLWRVSGSAGSVRLATSGAAPALAPASTAMARFVLSARSSPTFVVTSVTAAAQQRIAYALGAKSSAYVVYAERTIPANRRVSVEAGSAFSEINFATYLGPHTDLAHLATTNVAVGRPPLSGTTARSSIPFGNTVITLITSPIGPLGGTFDADIPWFVLAGGALLTVLSALVAWHLSRRERDAERNALTITSLYGQLDEAYGQQRRIAQTLQQALLPRRTPHVPGLEVATRYVAGDVGVDIGGDWYSLNPIDERHFGFVVGDVSGRGVGAAAIMARVRFTLRAYLLEGHPPELALAMCARQLDIIADGHMSTVLIGSVDVTTRQVTLATAGHPPPLLLHRGGEGARFADVLTGPPLGVGAVTYRSTTLSMPPGSTLIAYTDGLVERREEDLSIGFARLADLAASSSESSSQSPSESVDELLTRLLAGMTTEGAADDIAILAFRWVSAPPE